MSSSECAASTRDGSDPSFPKNNTSVKLRDAATSAPALSLNLSGAPRTEASQLDSWELGAEDGVDQALLIEDDTYVEDSVDTAFQDIVAPARFKRTDQAIRKFCAKIQTGPYAC